MACRPGAWVLEGEINHSRRNSVNGWIRCVAWKGLDEVKESAEDIVFHLQLTGNLAGELAGRHFRFRNRSPESKLEEPTWQQAFQPMQIGVMGDSAWRVVRVPLIPIEEFYMQRKAGLNPPETQLPSLYLEWYGQNGRVVVELTDPILEFSDNFIELADPEPEPLTDEANAGSLSIDMISKNPDGTFEVERLSTESDSDDEYGLFPNDLEEQLQSSTYEVESDEDFEFMTADDHDSVPPQKRDWEEVIPGIDPKTKAMYEKWDELFDGEHDEPLSWLFESPLHLPTPDQLADEASAWQALSSLLTAMASRGVAFDMCEHYTAIKGYRLLIEEILPEANVHPDMVSTGFVQHYSSCEFCEECDAEFEAEYQQLNPD